MNRRRLFLALLSVVALGTLVDCVRYESPGAAPRACPYRRPHRR